MQVLKDNIKKSILEEAQKEFLEKGFGDASLRNIAAKVGISVSTIYSYYKNKDELMTAVCQPVIDEANKLVVIHHSADTDMEDMLNISNQLIEAKDIMNLVAKYRDIIRLILFRSEGSTMNHFRDEFTDKTTAHMLWFFGKMKMKYPQINTDISYFFIHASCAWVVSIVGELVSHDLSDDEINKFMADYVKFSTIGWANLFGMPVK